MKTLGICFGASTIQCVSLSGTTPEVISVQRKAHEGNPRSAFKTILQNIDILSFDNIAITGRSFRKTIALSSISEPEAIEYALRKEYAQSPVPEFVVSAGGETQLAYKINSSKGITSVLSGNKCASGTGEFFLQQIRRMGMTLEDAVALAQQGTPRKIAGRCSVFCKSDCTHALNTGEPISNITAGLCVMMADKISELVSSTHCKSIAVIGGGTLNKAVIELLKLRYDNVHIPDVAHAFEAWGAALWAQENPCIPFPKSVDDVFSEKKLSFSLHPALASASHLVDFKVNKHGTLFAGDNCILGLDVGSTTTKAVLMKQSDSTIVASVYLRTNGNPVEASKNCYRALAEQTAGIDFNIIGLGVTGSGRQIAGLHALTDTIINEIIAHAAAAAHYDPDVDTIFEIGGQDAKYTYLTSGVPSDYAMNEACSAGTGSFLEESAWESLGVSMEHIGEQALTGNKPPNFSDQCSAFISSDIKQAGQQGILKNDILAGLVYSVCMNYLNRVKGTRPTGTKIFMQGGVCYNRAVPYAMASLMQSPIIVPPDPGLMGALGVALSVAERIAQKTTQPAVFNLQQLIDREAVTDGYFMCNGGTEHCDRKCRITRIRINGTLYPFGGACNKYYNVRFNSSVNVQDLDLVAVRRNLLINTYGITGISPFHAADTPEKTVGISLSFITHSLFPLYSRFFSNLGFTVIVSDEIDETGVKYCQAAFCLPAEQSHGSFYSLLKKNPDYIFLPHVMQMHVPNVPTYSKTCVFVQGEPYYLPVTFRDELDKRSIHLLQPVLNMSGSYSNAADTFTSLSQSLGVSSTDALKAFTDACTQQESFDEALKKHGRKALAYLDEHPETFGVVLFGRPYNAFAQEANMGIPHKIASRGYMIIPHDMLPADEYVVHRKMFWAMGQKIMKAAQFVKARNNLFGCYITNFSCGPDAFLLGFFRRAMQSKPSLTLELDQHTADAGLDTRIEAALDIMAAFRTSIPNSTSPTDYIPATLHFGSEAYVIDSQGKKRSLHDPSVEIILPSMGRYGTEALAAVMRGIGFNAKALPIADQNVLLKGRKNASCKECLPYMVTIGSFLSYLDQKTDPDKVTLIFMPTGGGPCRLGQYCVAIEHVLERHRLPNVAVLSLTDENGYAGLGKTALLNAWQAIVTSDIFEDMRSVISANAVHPVQALKILEDEWNELLFHLEKCKKNSFVSVLSKTAKRLKTIKLKSSLTDIPRISLIGEIFVRKDDFSRQNITGYLENHGFAVRVAPIAEFMCYGNYVINRDLGERRFTAKELLIMRITSYIQLWWEWRVKRILSRSGLYHFEMIDVAKTIHHAEHVINVNLRGETMLTVGLGLREIINESCGVISIGPFGCMPSRVAESILKKEMTVVGKKRIAGTTIPRSVEKASDTLPFYALETDGSNFPLQVEANLEAFVVQAHRLHRLIHKVL